MKKITNFLFEIATLRRMVRSHHQMIKEADDNISDHIFRVAVIGNILAKLENCDDAKVIKMCLFHDILETRTGDANFINRQYTEQKEEEARKDQLEGLPIAEEVLELLEEYEKRESKESIVAKDADNLDQMLLQQEFLLRDDENRKVWQDFTEKKLKTESAKKIAKEIRKTNPFEWLYSLAEKKTGYKIDN